MSIKKLFDNNRQAVTVSKYMKKTSPGNLGDGRRILHPGGLGNSPGSLGGGPGSPGSGPGNLHPCVISCHFRPSWALWPPCVTMGQATQCFFEHPCRLESSASEDPIC